MAKATPGPGSPSSRCSGRARSAPRVFTINLTPEQFDRAQTGLVSANSYITAEVSDQFKAHGKTLTDRVRISDAAGRDAWLLTEPGLGLYLVEQLAGRRGFTVFTASLKLVHSDLTAIITGPRAGRFAFSENSPTFFNNPALPDRRQPYREFTIIYHFLPATVQAFDQFGEASTSNAFAAGLDQYGINYGVAAIGPEVIANRMGVGPMGNADAVNLKFEEFFLSSWAVGDPAMIVDVAAGDQAKAHFPRPPVKLLFSVNATPALLDGMDNGTIAADLKAKFKAAGVDLLAGSNATQISRYREWKVFDQESAAKPARGQYTVLASEAQRGGQTVKVLNVYAGPLGPAPAALGPATKALFPDDPSNVYHSNLRDHVKFRILHAGAGPAHVHHLHAHQWLHTPNDADGPVPRQPAHHPGLGLHARHGLQRQRQPQHDRRRLDLPLPFLPALRQGDVEPLAGPRRLRGGDAARR